MSFDKKAANAKAQKIFAEKMKLEGKKQKIFWATDEEAEMIKDVLERFRTSKRVYEDQEIFISVDFNKINTWFDEKFPVKKEFKKGKINYETLGNL